MPDVSADVVNSIVDRIRDYVHRAERAKQWRKWVADLRSSHPAELPVRVVRRPLKVNHGLTTKCGKTHFLITIDSALPNSIAWMILLHEWAHALAWNDDQAAVDHDDAWGIAFAMLWRDNHGDADYTPE